MKRYIPNDIVKFQNSRNREDTKSFQGRKEWGGKMTKTGNIQCITHIINRLKSNTVNGKTVEMSLELQKLVAT